MAEEFIGMGIALAVVVASIMLSGILFGVGRAFGYKKIEYFGIDELIQSIVNAAIIGSFAAIIALVGDVSRSLVSQSCAGATATVVDQLFCVLSTSNSAIFSLFQELTKTLSIVAYYQNLSLNFGSFTVLPFGNLSSLSGILSAQLLSLNTIMLLIALNMQIVLFIKQNILSIILPLGLVLRTLFATRKVGGFLIALAIGLTLFYPAFVLIFPSPQADLNSSVSYLKTFNSNPYYAPIPVVDLNNNYALAGKIDIMSGRCTNASNSSACNNFFLLLPQNVSSLNNQTPFDMSSDLSILSSSTSTSLAKSLLYAVVAPIFSLLVTVVFIRELAS
ncbi:hypothetical protein HZC07_05170, partial [Candidatus Micrarchaeota archaeon]|nr:hypothetical protein [Candidatus Micrarchaeota archaeon]